jgi:NDP-sugar pyrophosphorylase family protein
MKALLICPVDSAAVPRLAETGPLATAPILGDCIVVHWIECLAGLGARQIEVIAPEGAEQVREAVGDGARWGVRVNVTVSRFEPTRQEAVDKHNPDGGPEWLPPPHDVVVMSHLPGCAGLPLFDSYANWFAALTAWVPLALTPARVRVSQVRPGIWMGSRAQVSPKAELIAPCWIGDRVSVEAGAVVGPHAIIEDRSVVGSTARIAQSWVGPDTFVGGMTSVANSLAWGSTLIDWRTNSVLRVPDPFLLSSLSKSKVAAMTDRFGRALGTRAPAGRRIDLGKAVAAPSRSAASDANLPA